MPVKKPEQKREFLRLLGEGLSQKEARLRVGVAKGTAYRWTHPEKDQEYARAAASVKTCACGRGMARHAQRCKHCQGWPDKVRREKFIARWNEGVPTFFLALEFGMTQHAAHQWASTLRKRGFPVKIRGQSVRF